MKIEALTPPTPLVLPTFQPAPARLGAGWAIEVRRVARCGRRLGLAGEVEAAVAGEVHAAVEAHLDAAARGWGKVFRAWVPGSGCWA